MCESVWGLGSCFDSGLSAFLCSKIGFFCFHNLRSFLPLSSSKFYELDLNIKGHFKLVECMKEFLKKEVLEGDNKYFCMACQQKQEATRQIILEQLPPVLNVQLLRFVFDR